MVPMGMQPQTALQIHTAKLMPEKVNQLFRKKYHNSIIFRSYSSQDIHQIMPNDPGLACDNPLPTPYACEFHLWFAFYAYADATYYYTNYSNQLLNLN